MPHKSSSPTVEDKALESESNKSVDSDEAESTSNDGDSTDDDSDEAKFGTAVSLTYHHIVSHAVNMAINSF